jgi:hemerythrin-like domain-containing protein
MLQRLIRRIPLMVRLLTGRKPDAPDLLKLQHMKVEVLLVACKIARDEERRRRRHQQLGAALGTHMEIEDVVFYPICEQHPELAKLVSGNYAEHQRMRDLLRRMAEVPARSAQFDLLFNELFLLINRHVNEEENALFSRMKRLMRRESRLRLADEMLRYHRARAGQYAA